MNALSGKKMLTTTILAAIASIGSLIGTMVGHDLGDLTCAIADQVTEGGCATMRSPIIVGIVKLLVAAFTTWAAAKGILMVQTQLKAGATMAEVGTVVGEVKEAIVKGIVPPVEITHPALAEPPTPKAVAQIKAINSDVAAQVS